MTEVLATTYIADAPAMACPGEAIMRGQKGGGVRKEVTFVTPG
jgi:hypothetical protein